MSVSVSLRSFAPSSHRCLDTVFRLLRFPNTTKKRSGAFGNVFLARWRSTEVACKCLSPSLLVADGSSGGAHSPAAVADLMREAGILAGLRHPCVVSVYGVVLPECIAEPDSGPHLSQGARCALALALGLLFSLFCVCRGAILLLSRHRLAPRCHAYD